MKKISLALLCTAAALFVSGCVKDFHVRGRNYLPAKPRRTGRINFKEGKCPEKNAQGKAKTAGYCQDAKDEDTKVFTYDPFTVDQLKENCSKIIPGSSYKDK